MYYCNPILFLLYMILKQSTSLKGIFLCAIFIVYLIKDTVREKSSH